MEDENGLELRLSLAWCQSSSNSKDIDDNSSDTRTEEGDRSGKLINDFKHFLEGGTGKLESATGSQQRDPLKPDETGLWMSNDNKRPKVEEEKGPEFSYQRKFFFEMGKQKKLERESHNSDLQERSRQSHIPMNPDDGSNAENEDVADSEVVSSTSRMVSCQENSGKKCIMGTGLTEIDKEVYTVLDTSAVDVSGQRGFTITPEKEYRPGKLPYGAAFPSRSMNILNMPNSISAKEHGGDVSALFGYSSAQLPVLDKDNSRSLVSHPQQLLPSYGGRLTPNMDKINDGSSYISQAAVPSKVPKYSGTILENAKTEGEQQTRESGSKLPAITPGIGSDLKFEGCRSFPNLPWVSTKGPGPNGRTISGVTYRFSPTQIKIVCACHGSHMSPEEFVQHASGEKTGPESGSGSLSLPGNDNPAASAQS